MVDNDSAVVTHGDGDLVRITDMDLAVYAHMLHRLKEADLEVVDVVRHGRGKHVFTFRDPGGIIRKVELEFANGRDSNFADAQRSLKKIMRKTLNSRKPHERTRAG